jgi:hypothetical protein
MLRFVNFALIWGEVHTKEKNQFRFSFHNRLGAMQNTSIIQESENFQRQLGSHITYASGDISCHLIYPIFSVILIFVLV